MEDLLISFGPDRILEGITPGRPPRDSAFFVNGMDVVFLEGGVQPLPSQVTLVPKVAVAPVMGLGEGFSNGQKSLFIGTTDTIYRYNEGDVTLTDVSGAAYSFNEDQIPVSPASMWGFERWGQWVLATNGVAPPQVYKGASFANLTGLNFTTAEVFLRYKTYMFAFNTDAGGSTFHWSDYDDVESWVPASTNHAGDLTIRDMNSDITAAARLGDAMIVYGLDSSHIVQYLGGPPYFFGVNQAIAGIGCYGKHALIVADDKHWGFGPNGIWVSNGAEATYIDSPSIRDYVFEDFNDTQSSKIAAFHDPSLSLVGFYYPSHNSKVNDRGVAFNYKHKCWTILGHGRAAAIYGVFNKVMLGTSSGGVLYMLPDTDAGGGLASGAPETLVETLQLKTGVGAGGFGENGFGGTTIYTEE